MGGNRVGCCRFNGLDRFFFTQKIGEYGYGFVADEEEEISGDSITIYGSTFFADASDFLKAFPQYTLDDYLYKLSIAKVQFLSVDNTHIKYLKGKNKKIWEGYKEAYKAQENLDTFISNFNVPELEDGEEYDIPLRKPKK